MVFNALSRFPLANTITLIDCGCINLLKYGPPIIHLVGKTKYLTSKFKLSTKKWVHKSSDIC